MSVVAPLRPDAAPLERTARRDERLARRAAGLDVVPAPDRRSARPPRRLRTVAPPRRRRSPAVPVLVGVGIVLVALFALAAMHALLISGQVHLDAMRRDVASEHEQIRRLELREAELESPGRVLDAARQRLGMVEPDEVGYLLPDTVATGDEAPVRVAAAKPAPPPDPESDLESAADHSTADPSVRPENGDEPPTTVAVGGAPTDRATSAADLPSEGGRGE